MISQAAAPARVASICAMLLGVPVPRRRDGGRVLLSGSGCSGDGCRQRHRPRDRRAVRRRGRARRRSRPLARGRRGRVVASLRRTGARASRSSSRSTSAIGGRGRGGAATGVAEATGRIDVLVNSAGVREIGDVYSLPAEEWENVIAINLSGTFYCCQAAARLDARDGRRVDRQPLLGRRADRASRTGRPTPPRSTGSSA